MFPLRGAVAQLARALAWHARGRGFESHQLHRCVGSGHGNLVSRHIGTVRYRWPSLRHVTRSSIYLRPLVQMSALPPFPPSLPLNNRPPAIRQTEKQATCPPGQARRERLPLDNQQHSDATTARPTTRASVAQSEGIPAPTLMHHSLPESAHPVQFAQIAVRRHNTNSHLDTYA